MRPPKPLLSIAALPAALLAFTLCACADYRKCGFRGCPGDAQISAQVEEQLGHYPALQPPNLLSVHALNHVVYLSGLVDTDLERQMAESVAAGVPGVARVVNSIGISGNR